ncbi:MAG: SUMF1/EgtB/PvdO family nonheme iron enzyme [Anaerolineae bacterium]|nr:SUMF1/EgtB/PvdO family nonheme iron enzyme [Anaerolineae bacterium]
MIPINPYVAGNPVGGADTFFGREDVLKKLLGMLRSPSENAITLFGQRRIGKTSILQELQRQLPTKGAYTPIYFDLQDKASWALNRVLFDLARTISVQLRMTPPKQDVFEQDEDYYRNVFLPEVFKKLGDKNTLILLLDEFDVLDNATENQAALAFFPYVRQLLNMGESKQKFVFVIGRKPEDLSNFALSLFKGVSTQRISLLERNHTEAVVRQSEKNKTLTWSDAAVEGVWQITHGHPYMTQLLCKVVWDTAYEDEEIDTPPIVTAEQVNAAIEEALKEGANAFSWIWDGLPPAERVVISALSELGQRPVNQFELEEMLQASGVRIVMRELELAPNTLVEWDLLEELEHNTYQFRVELLRQWICKKKPLARVKEELDRLDPLAEMLFQSGNVYYNNRQFPEAIDLLQRALVANPNHLKAKLVLGRIWLEQKEIVKAAELLEEAYTYEPAASRALLVQTLLIQADDAADEDTKLKTLGRVLEVQPNQLAAQRQTVAIWGKRAEGLVAKQQYEQALEIYTRIGDAEKVAEVRQHQHRQRLESITAEVRQLEKTEDWAQIVQLYETLLKEIPDDEEWQTALKRAQTQTKLRTLYLEALDAAEKAAPNRASDLLLEIVNADLHYKQAVLLLALTVKGAAVLQNAAQIYAEEVKLIPKVVEPPSEKPAPTGSTRRSKLPKATKTSDALPIEWCAIPKGKVKVGSLEITSEDSKMPKGGDFNVPAFAISKFPVTVAQFAEFLTDENGYTNPAWWEVPEDAIKWQKKHQKLMNSIDTDDNLPQTGITWDEAVAYCYWLGQKLDTEIALPTEQQWQRAAQGDDDRAYAWGKIFEKNRCNFNSRSTTPVDQFPYGASPYGVMDMCGNVEEWCDTSWSNYKAIRGGSWMDRRESAVSIKHRNWRSPDNPSPAVGFRVIRLDKKSK